MANSAANVRVGANGAVFIAPDGSTLPTDLATALDAAFLDVGFVSEDGVKFTETKETFGIPAWQSMYDVRRLVERYTTKIEFEMLEWKKDNLEFALQGTVANNTTYYTFTPDRDGTITQYSVVVEWQDAGYSYRLVIPLGEIVDDVAFDLKRADDAGLPIGFEILDDGTNSPYTIHTDDPAFA